MAQSGSKTLKLFCLMIYLSSILNSFKCLEFFYGDEVDGIKPPPQPNANNGNFSPAFALNGQKSRKWLQKLPKISRLRRDLSEFHPKPTLGLHYCLVMDPVSLKLNILAAILELKNSYFNIRKSNKKNYDEQIFRHEEYFLSWWITV